MGRVPYVYCPKCEALMRRCYLRPKNVTVPIGHICLPCEHVEYDGVKV